MIKNKAFAPGSHLGILGGGQLGRMLAMVAMRMGYHVVIFTPETDAPAGEIASEIVIADYEDQEALAKFAEKVDLVTLEFENVPCETLEFLSQYVCVHPESSTLKIAQNRVYEKQFFDKNNISTAKWWHVTDHHSLEMAHRVQPISVLKQARFGYDGKGQWMLGQDSILPDFTGEAILESKIDFIKEISVIVARGYEGRIVSFPAVENRHQSHILHETFAPAALACDLAKQANLIASHIIDKLEMVGILAVEMFVTRGNELLVNEIAPRPHNSGHWSQQGASICQFELLLRVICGLPILPPKLLYPTYMRNLLGDEIANWHEYLADESATFYHYGKNEIRPGRKMGHVNFIRKVADESITE